MLRKPPSGPFVDTVQELLDGLPAGLVTSVRQTSFAPGALTWSDQYLDLATFPAVVTAADLPNKRRWILHTSFSVIDSASVDLTIALRTQAPGAAAPNLHATRAFHHFVRTIDAGAASEWGVVGEFTAQAAIESTGQVWAPGTGSILVSLSRAGGNATVLLAGGATLIELAGAFPCGFLIL